jgi:fatty-acyl-CoA synthase
MLHATGRALKGAARRSPCWITAANLATSPLFPDPGLSHVVGPRDPPLVHDTLASSLRRTVERSPSATAVISAAQGITLSYEQFLEQVEATACSLMALGVRRGDRVAIWSPNCVEWAVLQQAEPLAGAIQVSLNPALREDELVHTLTTCGVSHCHSGR